MHIWVKIHRFFLKLKEKDSDISKSSEKQSQFKLVLY